jgi:hypothetical protein
LLSLIIWYPVNRSEIFGPERVLDSRPVTV